MIPVDASRSLSHWPVASTRDSTLASDVAFYFPNGNSKTTQHLFFFSSFFFVPSKFFFLLFKFALHTVKREGNNSTQKIYLFIYSTWHSLNVARVVARTQQTFQEEIPFFFLLPLLLTLNKCKYLSWKIRVRQKSTYCCLMVGKYFRVYPIGPRLLHHRLQYCHRQDHRWTIGGRFVSGWSSSAYEMKQCTANRARTVNNLVGEP